MGFSRDHRPRPSLAILLIIAFQILFASLILFLVVRGARLEYGAYYAPDDHSVAEALGVLLLIAIPWVVTAIGMFKLRNWSRWLTLTLASVAVLGGCFGKMFYKRQPGWDFTPFLIELSLWISVPASIWWWIVLSLPGVRRQFH